MVTYSFVACFLRGRRLTRRRRVVVAAAALARAAHVLDFRFLCVFFWGRFAILWRAVFLSAFGVVVVVSIGSIGVLAAAVQNKRNRSSVFIAE